MIHKLFLLFRLKWKIFKRSMKQVPIVYVLLLLFLSALGVYVLVKLAVPVTWQSMAGAGIIQLFICTRLKYPSDKLLFLKQYPGMYQLSLFMDSFVFTFLFAFVHLYFWMVAVAVALLFSVFYPSLRHNITIRPVLPSPFFLKSGYLWHARQRYLLPAAWIMIALCIVISRVHDNFNLGMAALGVGTLVASFVTIMETENSDFVHIYVDAKRFIVRTLAETLFNTGIYLFPLIVALLVFFPEKWMITLLAFPVVVLVNTQLLWTKYSFYPSYSVAAVVFFFGMLMQGALSTTLYGLVVVPLYTVGLFFFFKKNIHSLLSTNERNYC